MALFLVVTLKYQALLPLATFIGGAVFFVYPVTFLQHKAQVSGFSE
jgi:hypothetical protein